MSVAVKDFHDSRKLPNSYLGPPPRPPGPAGPPGYSLKAVCHPLHPFWFWNGHKS